jgi:hypothetical protein
MTREISEIIKKHLPAQVGDVLKERLKQADQDATDLENAEKALLARGVDIDRLQKQVAEYRALDARNAELATREELVADRERHQNVFAAELKALEAEKRASELAGFVGMVFRSPIFRTSYQNDLFSNYNSQGLHCTTGGLPRESTTQEA